MKGEFELIDRIKEQFAVPEGLSGIGDDCAVIPQRDGVDTLVSTDMLMEGVHFLLEDIDPFDLGWKSAAVNISDIAAMGGRPVGSFLAFSLPRTLSDSFVEAFVAGYKALSDKYACPLLGGDTTSSPDRLCICVTVMGDCPSGQSVRRSTAAPGDLVCVTGKLGDSAAGLKVILGGLERGPQESALVERHYRPVPRVAEGISLRACGVHSMMDISDGIASDLRHILSSSNVGARIDMQALPLSEELLGCAARHSWDPLELAVGGGEDYELLFTMAPGTRVDVPHTVVGRIVEGDGVEWVGADRDFVGFRHF